MMILLLLLAQDDGLGPVFAHTDQEFSIRPPAQWTARSVESPALVRFAPVESPPSAHLVIIRYYCKNGTTLSQFKKQMAEYEKTVYPDATVLFDRQSTIAGQPAVQLALKAKDKSGEDVVVFRTVIHRSNLEYFLLDAQSRVGVWEKTQPLLEKSISTFKIVPYELSVEERAGAARESKALQDRILGRSELAGEVFQGIFLEKRKVGYTRTKLTSATIDGAPGWTFESDTVLDFGDGGRDQTSVRGSFTADGRFQKLESEETIVTEKKEELKYRMNAVLKGGRVTIKRHLRGTDEETSFAVPDGTLFVDVAEVFRRAVALGPKSTYLVPVLNPLENRVGQEWIENAGQERVETRTNEFKEIRIIFSTTDRRRTLNYWFDATGGPYVVKGPKQVFILLGMSKEEAMKMPEEPKKP